ncbi:MAG: hypothetical protein IPF68_13735 [Bacteroidales bacterium]|nr:hypothetical protein [Bacteroidales bacterium]
MESITGVSITIPGKPYVLRILMIKRFRRVNIFPAEILLLRGRAIFKGKPAILRNTLYKPGEYLQYSLKILLLRKKKKITPNNPPAVVLNSVWRYEYPKR